MQPNAINLQVGIFSEELCISFRNILQETLEAFVSRTINLATDIHATAQDEQSFESRLANGLHSVATWDSDLKDRYCAQIASAYPQITELYRYTYLLYLKDMYSRHLSETIIRVAIPSLSNMLNTFLRLACSSQSLQNGEYHSMKYWERVLFIEDIIRRMLYELVVRQNSVKGYINRSAQDATPLDAPPPQHPPPQHPNIQVQPDVAMSHDLFHQTPYKVPTDPSSAYPQRPPQPPLHPQSAQSLPPLQPTATTPQPTPSHTPRTYTPANLAGVGNVPPSHVPPTYVPPSHVPPTHVPPTQSQQPDPTPSFGFYTPQKSSIPQTLQPSRHSVPLPRVPQEQHPSITSKGEAGSTSFSQTTRASQESNTSRASEATSHGAPPVSSVIESGLRVDAKKFTSRRPTGSSLPEPVITNGIEHHMDDHDLAPSEQDWEGEVRRVLDTATTGTIMPHDSVSNIGAGGAAGVMGPPPQIF